MSTTITHDLPVESLLQLSTAAVAALDRDGRILRVSPSIEAAMAHSDLPLGDRPSFLSFLHPDDLASAVEVFERNVAHVGAGTAFRSRFRSRATNPWHWIEVTTNNQLENPAINALIATIRGVDSETQIERALRDSEARLRAVVESAPVVLVAYDTEGIITLADGQGFQALPEGSNGLVGLPMSIFFDEHPGIEEGLVEVLRGGRHHATLEIAGTVLELRSSPIVQNGVITGGLAIGTDVTDRTQAHEELVRREERFRGLVQRSSDIATIFDAAGRILYISPACRLLGYEPEELIGTDSFALCHPDDVEDAKSSVPWLLSRPGSTITHELRVRDGSGAYRWVEEVLSNHLDDPAIEGIVGNIRDITERREGELELQRRATTDDLTGLANRIELTERLEQRIAGSSTERATVVFLDLDEFKLVNDSLGHTFGDALLRQVATRLRSLVRGRDLIARFGGDEFVVLCEGGDERAPALLAERLLGAFDAPFIVGGEPLQMSASIGVATSPPHDAETLLRRADAAMYRAKELGRNRVEHFDESLAEQSTSVLRLRSEMRLGLEQDQFVLHYQPIVDLATETVVGMEALLRWVHPVRGVVPPLDFIPEAEHSGLIAPLGAWVMRTACLEAATWPAPMHVAVNLSVRQLADHGIVDTVADALAASGLDPSALVLEVTESALMANAETALVVLNELKALGIRLAIDDFGTGYSSLIYLKRMPVDTLKVDRSFVDGLGDDAEDSAIVASVIGLAHAVGLRAVAEGVETRAQQQHLLELGCDLAQGYLWSRPVPAAEIPALLGRS